MLSTLIEVTTFASEEFTMQEHGTNTSISTTQDDPLLQLVVSQPNTCASKGIFKPNPKYALHVQEHHNTLENLTLALKDPK
jgi:hypothetical protein